MVDGPQSFHVLFESMIQVAIKFYFKSFFYKTTVNVYSEQSVYVHAPRWSLDYFDLFSS